MRKKRGGKWQVVDVRGRGVAETVILGVRG